MLQLLPLFDRLGVTPWRGLFAFSILPALVSLHIRGKVSESEAWERTRSAPRRHPELHLRADRDDRPTLLIVIVLALLGSEARNVGFGSAATSAVEPYGSGASDGPGRRLGRAAQVPAGDRSGSPWA